MRGRRVLLGLAAACLALGVPSTSAAVADPGSTQQIVVTAPSYASSSGTLTAYQFTGGVWHSVYGPVSAELGVHGLSDNRSEGDGTTPTGTYGIQSTMYGLADAVPNARYAYHHLVCGDWWSGVRDATYNTFQHIECGQTMDNSEALWQQTTAYQHFAVIDFNTNPTVIGKGSAIFLHDATASGVTAGCVAVAPSALDAVLSWLDPAQNPVIRIGTRAQVGPPTPLAGPPPAPPKPARPAAVTAATPRPATTVAARPRPTLAPTTSTSTSTTTEPTTTTTAAPATVAIRALPASTDSGRTAPATVAAAVLLLGAAFAVFVAGRQHH
ncbi:MAG: L,D-transpeptidase family protein [Acidimicrobiia bacterium]|nr:L,D-transpeptidase family protein [Acidimicrobiia bacterium]